MRTSSLHCILHAKDQDFTGGGAVGAKSSWTRIDPSNRPIFCERPNTPQFYSPQTINDHIFYYFDHVKGTLLSLSRPRICLKLGRCAEISLVFWLSPNSTREFEALA